MTVKLASLSGELDLLVAPLRLLWRGAEILFDLAWEAAVLLARGVVHLLHGASLVVQVVLWLIQAGLLGVLLALLFALPTTLFSWDRWMARAADHGEVFRVCEYRREGCASDVPPDTDRDG